MTLPQRALIALFSKDNPVRVADLALLLDTDPQRLYSLCKSLKAQSLIERIDAGTFQITTQGIKEVDRWLDEIERLTGYQFVAA